MAGDYNVIPTPADARFPEAWTNDALFLPETRNSYRAIGQPWFHRRRSRRERGSRHLYILGLSGRRVAEEQWHPDRSSLCCRRRRRSRLSAAGIDKHVRGWEKPSDHVPVWIDLDFGEK